MACAGFTELGEAAPAGRVRLDLAKAYELSPSVALRHEPFGALSYHYETRRLNFLRSRQLVAVVESLGTKPSVTAALEACGVPEPSRPGIERALSLLLESGVIRAR